MPRLSPILLEYAENVLGFHCPGCGYGHNVTVNPKKNGMGAGWDWNGNVDAPTFSPSILVHGDLGTYPKCHSFVKDGQIQFLTDSTHALAGQTVPLPPILE